MRPILAIVLAAALLACAPMSPEPAHRGPSGADFLERPDPQSVRILNWNVKGNSILPPNGPRQRPFHRILRAVDPDIVVLQEVLRPGSTEQVLSMVRKALPSRSGRMWSAHAVSDNLVLSRFPLLRRDGEGVVHYPQTNWGVPNFHYGQVRVLIDLPDEIAARDLYLIGVHNKSRSGPENIARRQYQSDFIAARLRELLDDRHPDALPPRTPVVILGDLNVLASEPADPLRHLTTLLTGDIIDEARHGPDFQPDWDGSNLIEVKPRHNATGKDYYTWRIDPEPFPNGALDRVLYTDSVLDVAHAFVLDTTTIDPGLLQRSGLLSDDVLLDGRSGVFDHLPMVVDFRFPAKAR